MPNVDPEVLEARITVLEEKVAQLQRGMTTDMRDEGDALAPSARGAPVATEKFAHEADFRLHRGVRQGAGGGTPSEEDATAAGEHDRERRKQQQ